MEPTIVEVLRLFQDSRFAREGTIIRLGGGFVRDHLLKLTKFHDFDVVIEGCSALECAESFCCFLDAVVGLKDSKPPKIRTLTPLAGQIVVKVHIRHMDITCDFTAIDAADKNQLLHDAQRRDFSMNALYWNLKTNDIEDPLGFGLYDLKKGILRCPICPKQTFLADPVRIIRAARFLAEKSDKSLDPAARAILKNAEITDKMQHDVPDDRIRAETIRLLRTTNYERGLDLLSDNLKILLKIRSVMIGESSAFWCWRSLIDNYMETYSHVPGSFVDEEQIFAQ